MNFSGTQIIDRRDAAVAAALAGTVVVILGYASGLGIQIPVALVATEPPAQSSVPATSADPSAPPADTAMAMPAAGAMPHTAAAAGAMPQHEGSPNSYAPEGSAGPTSGPPTASDADPTCPPGVLDGLPVAGQLTGAASSILFTLVGATTPVLGQLAGAAPDKELVPLTCTVSTGAGAGLVR